MELRPVSPFAPRGSSTSRTSSAYPAKADRFLLSTFGLISAGKGLETVIDALPAIIERHPQIAYVIAGRTHPDVARREGERYRLMLERRVLELDLDDHVEFDDRFLTIEEVSDLLAATDVFVTPYHGREQIASGALTFAIAAGCAVVSTPYWYAQDMLASGAGRLVPFGDPAALAAAVCAYIEQPEALAAVASRGATHRFRTRVAVGRQRNCRGPATRRMRSAPRRRPSGVADLHLTSLRSDHLLTLVDDVGIVQHANGIIPNRDSGYCVDDVARLAVVVARARQPRRRATLELDPLPGAGLPVRCHRGRRDAQLHGLRPSLARRAAHRRPRRPLGLGTRRDPRDRVDPRRRRSGTRPARTARRGALRGRLPANSRLHGARPLAPRRRPARAGSPTLARAPRRAARERLPQYRDRGLELVRGRAQLRQRAALAGADQRRQRTPSRRPDGARARVAPLARRRVRAVRRRVAFCRGTVDGVGASRRRAPATSSRSTPRRSSRPSWPRSRSPAGQHTASGRRGRSSGSLAATISRSRCTTSRPAAAATGSAARRSTRTKAPNRRSPSTAQRSSSTPPASGRRCASARSSRRRYEPNPSSSAATTANPILTTEDWPYPVNAVFNPAAAAFDGRNRFSSRGSRTAGASPIYPSPARPTASTAGRSIQSRCSHQTTQPRASSGASRTRVPSGSRNSAAG